MLRYIKAKYSQIEGDPSLGDIIISLVMVLYYAMRRH